MATQLTAEDARQSLQSHAAAKGSEICEKYGEIGWGQLLQILADTTVVRYPCEVSFDSTALEAGECAFAQPNGDEPSDGFTIFVHPHFVNQPGDAISLVLYQLVLVNYGPFASAEDAEAFGAAALGILVEEYYDRMCRLADQLG
jgi:hypothetical protein